MPDLKKPRNIFFCTIKTQFVMKDSSLTAQEDNKVETDNFSNYIVLGFPVVLMLHRQPKQHECR